MEELPNSRKVIHVKSLAVRDYEDPYHMDIDLWVSDRHGSEKDGYEKLAKWKFCNHLVID
ncbi:hypothetical protein KIN20_028622 [Parelaphostrongylus tenuis]|uniref:Uncharacterized protein n=1 Tax=Parelaphostrongylus tenuis TaxID=148309 RepID=A0AAD5R184_PARTN|nr:hypothetical protein KIN20_028622 [Parelaphostrongylus tenuis]